MSQHHYDAIIFDLDGVVTDTAKVHATAWKELFDNYLKKREQRDRELFRPFDITTDYLTFVDGKPRYDGVQSFLESRNIHIPRGEPSDKPDLETVCGLGNQKNLKFSEILERDGAEIFQTTVDLIKKLRAQGIKTAIVSSSKNCQAVLKIAGLESLFDARVDGAVSESLGLKGKPDPDIFIKSTQLLGVSPDRSGIVEDAISGVEAGRRGKFGLVIGVDRHGDPASLKDNGADLVVSDLGEMTLDRIDEWFVQHGPNLPSALESLDEISQRIENKRAVVFLDYDGTLTPIVEQPDNAVMTEKMRDIVQQLAKTLTVGIVSGRARPKVFNFVKLDELIYAGSHGFDIACPGRSQIIHEAGKGFLPAIDKVYKEISKLVKPIEGSLVEHTGFSISVHYRLVSEDQVPRMEAMVDQLLTENPTLRKTHGKKVFEIRPKIDWDKGKAVLWILKALELDGSNVMPFYLGDDTTDEDAFRVLEERGIGILVTDTTKFTRASYTLKDTDEVGQFLKSLMGLVKQGS
ncbi:MAG: trehalose-phosphatase [Deltaproteobacteria bacterium]|nr:trehalose-phosphatase [Deltaproteobacteria bacterium]